MAVSALFSKINELERRLEQLASLDHTGSAAPVSNSAQVDDMSNRISAMENKLAAFDTVLNKLSDIESRLLPADIPDKIRTLETTVSDFRPVLIANVNDLKSMSEKLNHLESITMPHVLSRLENLEHKVTEAA
jgi:hypothetical protein